MKLSDKLRAIALERVPAHDATDLVDAANVIDFACGQMQSMGWHMDGTASYRFAGGWPLSSVRARSAEEALMECVQIAEEAKREANRGG